MKYNDIIADIKKTEEIEEISDVELSELIGAGNDYGWMCTITDDCPSTIFLCC